MKPYRKEKLSSSIREIVSDHIAHRLNDPRISPFTTVTRVEVSGDLLSVKVFLSVMGTDVEERKTMAAITSAAGHIQRRVGGEIQLRQCPQLRFLVDESVKVARETMALIDENARQRGDLAPAADPAALDDEFDDTDDVEAHDPDGPEPLDPDDATADDEDDRGEDGR